MWFEGGSINSQQNLSFSCFFVGSVGFGLVFPLYELVFLHQQKKEEEKEKAVCS